MKVLRPGAVASIEIVPESTGSAKRSFEGATSRPLRLTTNPGSSFAGIRSRPEDRDNFTALLSLLRKKLDAASLTDGRGPDARYLLSIATGASVEHTAGVDITQVSPLLDFIGLMTYDLYNGWSTRTGPSIRQGTLSVNSEVFV